MSTVLTNGIIIPDNGSRNWGGDLANNWNIIDVNIGYMTDVKNRITTLENSVAENSSNIEINTSNISALQTSKQDTIEDLETIRAGASAGATAVQPSALNNYVDLSSEQTIGGLKTFSNDVVLNGNFNFRNSIDDGLIRVQGGSGEGKGSRLILSGKDRPGLEGIFELMATDGVSESLLRGTKDGLLTWCEKSVDCIEEQGGTYTDGWIRYSNGIQICWGNGLFTTGTEITYPKPFSGDHKMSIQATAGNVADLNVSTQNWGPTSFILLMNITEEQYVAWQAIGTWK